MNSDFQTSINFSRFKPLTDNNDSIYEWLDLTINSGDIVNEFQIDKNNISIYEVKDEFFGFQAITNDKKDVLAFYPIFDFPKPTVATIKGISVLENNLEAILTSKVDSATFSSLLYNYSNIAPHLPKLLDQKVLISYAGWIQSLEKQTSPPQIKQQNGSLVTTKGSSIFYNVEGKNPFEFVYQFNVQEHESVIWNDFIEIVQIKTTLFRTDKEKIELNLYGTERIFQSSYFPRKNDDIMGIMDLCSLTM